MNKLDLTGLRVITARDLEPAAAAKAEQVEVGASALITPAAKDYAYSKRLQFVRAGGNGAAQATTKSSILNRQSSISSPEALLNSAEAQPIKEEIIRNARKLWTRQYVDGNGGNLSYRIAENAVICTPTLCSKADVTVDDLCLVDMEGNQLAGKQKRTSEIFLHLEIYKAVPEAKGVVHAHPPHATAYAVIGRVPPGCIIPEHEVFVGNVAVTPYETPGTKAFAETVLPYVRTHNTILLGNHGVVCWADTVTHAEWYHEIVDTTCRILILTSSLGAPINRISGEKTKDLLAVKKRLGLPDARYELHECQLCEAPEFPQGITACPVGTGCGQPQQTSQPEVEALVRLVTDEVMKALGERS
ncbi:MAG: class II aldolase/adducin family protein [Acidobacteria bacterium]|nr:MAG: class II aldolase/adducin family protein [Acidobacteriota bacterium]